MKVQGKFKMQAHITSGVVMDIAAFKVSHCVGSDIDATTLQAEKARSAMDEMSQKVQNASSHPWNLPHTQGTRSIQRGNGTLHAWVRFSAKLTLPCHDTPPTVSIPLGRWMKYHGRFKMQALTFWDAKVTSTCTTAGQFKGAMERYMHGFNSAQNSRRPATIHRQQ